MTNETAIDIFRGDKLPETWRVCEGLAKSTLLPTEFRGKPENVMIAVMVSNRLRMDPFTIMQNISVINGRPMFSTQFLIAMANRSGIFSNPIDWEVSGDGPKLEVRAYATLRATGKVVSETISFAQAEADGWTRNAKYKTMPARMLKYRTASALIGLYAPELKMGFVTEEEAETIDVQAVPTPADELEAKLGPATAPPTRRGRPTNAERAARESQKVETVPAVHTTPAPEEPDEIAALEAAIASSAGQIRAMKERNAEAHIIEAAELAKDQLKKRYAELKARKGGADVGF